MNSYYAAADRAGICVDLRRRSRRPRHRRRRLSRGVRARWTAARQRSQARAVVVAAGGFEANIDWLREIWGDAADNFVIRGTPYNKGNAAQVAARCRRTAGGRSAQCHAIAVDARAPRFDGGIVTRLDSLPFGIVVNKHGERFYDEGEDAWPKRYAIWGRLIASQPDQIAFSIVDAKAMRTFMPSVFPPVAASFDPRARVRPASRRSVSRQTVAAFNRRGSPGLVRSHKARRLPHRGPGSKQDALGPASRHAAVLGLPASARDHLYVPRRQSGRRARGC